MQIRWELWLLSHSPGHKIWCQCDYKKIVKLFYLLGNYGAFDEVRELSLLKWNFHINAIRRGMDMHWRGLVYAMPHIETRVIRLLLSALVLLTHTINLCSMYDVHTTISIGHIFVCNVCVRITLMIIFSLVARINNCKNENLIVWHREGTSLSELHLIFI